MRICPRICAFFRYPLSKGVFWLWHHGWKLNSHVVIIGPLAFCVFWKERL